MVETREQGHETFPPSPVIRQIPFSVSRSFTIARILITSCGYSCIENDIRTDTKGGGGLKGRANVNFHLDDSISPPTRLDVSRATHWFPATFLGNRTGIARHNGFGEDVALSRF